MKRNRIIYCVTVFLLCLTLSAQAQEEGKKNDKEKSGSQKGPKISFEETKYDFGEIQQGDKVTHVFKFTNTGSEPLVLNNVNTTCGCTVPKWPKDPIMPGNTNEIKVIFNSSGKMGRQHKVVSIESNAVNHRAKLTLTGNVKPKNKGNSGK